MASQNTLIFGAGWIGTQFAQRVPRATLSKVDIAEAQSVEKVLAETQPTIVINCAAKSGNPNVDACEKDPEGTMRSNFTGAVLLARACAKRGVFMAHMSSGCFYEGTNQERGFTEADPPNFLANVYARSKAQAEKALEEFGVLSLRIRMPISEIPSRRNLLTKLIEYRSVLREPNSVTILEDFFPAALALIERRVRGPFNMVNPGVEYHDEVLAAYREIVDPIYRFEVISTADLQKKVLAPRSNCLLSTEKLRGLGLDLPEFNARLPALLKAYAKASR